VAVIEVTMIKWETAYVFAHKCNHKVARRIKLFSNFFEMIKFVSLTFISSVTTQTSNVHLKFNEFYSESELQEACNIS